MIPSLIYADRYRNEGTRTLYAIDDEISHAIKVHFSFRISRYGRKMRDEVLEQSINISRELERGIRHLDDRFAFIFPDYAKYLPKTIRHFSEERDQFGKPFYQDTGKVPEWRP